MEKNNRVCPLLSIAKGKEAKCIKERCAFYIEPFKAFQGGCVFLFRNMVLRD